MGFLSSLFLSREIGLKKNVEMGFVQEEEEERERVREEREEGEI